MLVSSVLEWCDLVLVSGDVLRAETGVAESRVTRVSLVSTVRSMSYTSITSASLGQIFKIIFWIISVNLS